MVTIRGQVLQPSCCNRFGLGHGFYVATEFSQDQGFSYRDRIFLCRDRIGQCKGILCCDREFDVTKELPKIVSQQSIPYVATKSSRT